LTLLANGSDPNESWTPCHSASKDVFSLQIHSVYAEALGNRPLHAAVVKHFSVSMCKALIYHSADVNAEDQSGFNALEFLVKRVHGLQHPQRKRMMQMAEFLRKEGMVLRRSDLLLNHVWDRDAEAVRLLLEAKASANDCRSFRYASPLFLAAGKVGDASLTQAFLEYGADVGVINLSGETAVQVAQKKGHEEAASVILSWPLGSHPPDVCEEEFRMCAEDREHQVITI
jgi:ankyrin repeat protein